MLIKKDGDFEPAPEGVHDAVCVDVIEGITRQTPWGPMDKIRLVHELPECLGKDGKPLFATREYTPSINEKSNFFKDLKGWFGRGPTDSFDTEKLVGVCSQLVIQHSEKDGKTYANITVMMRPKKQVQSTSGYIRKKDRPQQGNAAAPNGQDAPPPMEEEIPF